MFKSQRAKATEYGELVKTSTSPEASREFQKLERTPTEDTFSDARLRAAALSRWDDEGGAVGDGLPM